MFRFPLKIDQLLIKVLPGAAVSNRMPLWKLFLDLHFKFSTQTLSQEHTYLYGIYYDCDAFGEHAMENGFV